MQAAGYSYSPTLLTTMFGSRAADVYPGIPQGFTLSPTLPACEMLSTGRRTRYPGFLARAYSILGVFRKDQAKEILLTRCIFACVIFESPDGGLIAVRHQSVSQ